MNGANEFATEPVERLACEFRFIVESIYRQHLMEELSEFPRGSCELGLVDKA